MIESFARTARSLVEMVDDVPQLLREPGIAGREFWVALGVAVALGLLWGTLRAWREHDRRLALWTVPGAFLASGAALVAARWLAPGERLSLQVGLTLRVGLAFAAAIFAGMLVAVAVPRLRPLLARVLIVIAVLSPLVAVISAPRRPAAPRESVPVVQRDGMVRVPAGWFLRGSLDPAQHAAQVGGESGDERPVREIFLDAFWIDAHEVTNASFRQFVAANDFTTEVERRRSGSVWSGEGWQKVEGADWRHPTGAGSGVEGRDAHPVAQVSWNDAAAYCAWAKKRLPTEAEWEKAARGSDGRDFPWGSDFEPARTNYCDRRCPIPGRSDPLGPDDGYDYTSPVGAFPAGASPYGVLDMAGNVREWVADWYHPDYYAFSTERDPRGPGPGRLEARVLRGGSFATGSGDVRTASRSFDPPWIGFAGVGFRCARDAEPADTGDR